MGRWGKGWRIYLTLPFLGLVEVPISIETVGWDMVTGEIKNCVIDMIMSLSMRAAQMEIFHSNQMCAVLSETHMRLEMAKDILFFLSSPYSITHRASTVSISSTVAGP